MTTFIKKIIVPGSLALLATFAGAQKAQAQLTDPGPYWWVVSAGGGSADIPYQGNRWDKRYDSVVVSYTVGESCIAYGHTGKFDVTEGFQQPDGYGLKPYDPFDAIEDLTFYPNPCRQFAYVTFTLNESYTDLNLRVFDLGGHKCYEDHFTSGDGKLTYQLPTTNLAPGMYIVEIVGFTKKHYVGKLIVIP